VHGLRRRDGPHISIGRARRALNPVFAALNFLTPRPKDQSVEFRRNCRLATASLVTLVAAAISVAGEPASAQKRVAWNDEVFALQPGHAPRNLTRSWDWETTAVPSPNGSRIAFARRGPRGLELWLMQANGGAQRRLSAGDISDESGFVRIAWRPDGRALAFHAWSLCPLGPSRNCTATEIRVVRADGTGERTVVKPLYGRGDRNPTWSGDGRRLAFETDIDSDGSAHAVGVVDANGRNRRRVLSTGVEREGESLDSLEWSPRGDRLAVRAHWRASRVLVRDLRSGRTTAISNASAFAWSPSGRLAFFRGGAIWTSLGDGRSARKLTKLRGCHLDALAWAPDGTSIAFLDAVHRRLPARRTQCELHVVGVADGARRVLARRIARPNYPSLAWERKIGILYTARWHPGDRGAPSYGVPGALPDGVIDPYIEAWRGWPVHPVNSQHPVRGSFLDPRPHGFHTGIDVNVPDDVPEPDAPPGRTHRVYAVGRGHAEFRTDVRSVGCANGRVDIGMFSYQHVDPTGVIRDSQWINAGQWIGWTCANMWHLHLSEWANLDGRTVWVNPLRPDGKLQPYVDTLPPTIGAIEFFALADSVWEWERDSTGAVSMPPAGTRLSPLNLHGYVDVRALITDRQSFLDWLDTNHPELVAPHHPYRVRIELTRLRDRRLVLARDVFRAEAVSEDGETLPSLGGPTAFTSHYAPGTLQNVGAELCLRGVAARACAGQYWLRLFARPEGGGELTPWDTNLTRNGEYLLRVQAWDVMGNATSRSVVVRVANRPSWQLGARAERLEG
jgi:Tol biopolymer transport system component